MFGVVCLSVGSQFDIVPRLDITFLASDEDLEQGWPNHGLRATCGSLTFNMRLVEDFVKVEICLKYLLFFGSRF